ncbi:hypothetical protein FKP32DRAFT_1606292 [Trametes sanguinea]|nr:hypothetical protein FKP32DRAFT_1606292 [Trametes sanguinea]
MPFNYGLPDRLYNALVGTLRGSAAEFGAKIDFSAFVEALTAIGFRIDDKRTTTDVVVMWTPPKFAEQAQIFEITRPSSASEWAAEDQAIVAQELERKFGLVPARFIRFNGALASGFAIFIESEE